MESNGTCVCQLWSEFINDELTILNQDDQMKSGHIGMCLQGDNPTVMEAFPTGLLAALQCCLYLSAKSTADIMRLIPGKYVPCQER